MRLTDPGLISRRDAAIAAALSGAVLVILGYASGWGLNVPTAMAADVPVTSPTAGPPVVRPGPAPVPPVTVPITPPAQPAPRSLPTEPLEPLPTTTPASHSGMPAEPPPAEIPAPPLDGEPGVVCDAGLLASLGVDVPLGETLSSLLTSVTDVVDSTALLDGLVANEGSASTTDRVACLVDTLSEPSCCDPAATPAKTK